MRSINKETLKVIENVVARYANDTNILGIFLIGSAASNSMDNYSDIDLLCVTKTTDCLSRESFIDTNSNLPFEILFNTIDGLQEFLREENGSVYRTIAHMIDTGKPIYNPGDRLNELMTEAKCIIASPTKMTKNQSIMIRYSIEDFLSDARREYEEHNTATFMLYSEKLVSNVIESSLRKTNGYFRPPRQLMEYLNVHDVELEMLLREFYADNKLETLEKIAAHGLRLIGGKLSSEWRLIGQGK